jgi:DNA repair photolyase
MLFGDSPPPGLVGIAKLAAQSEVLEAKRVVQYFEMESRSMLNRTRPGMPFEWSLNPYRGCEFGCRYCYARYTHEFMELRESVDFEDRIYAKSGVGPILRRELKKIDGSKGIAIGTATDPYQPAERRFHRTRAALEVFAEQSGLALSITTKSDLVTRDIPLLRQIFKRNSVSVNMTITTLDASLARLLEPRAPRPELRLKAVQAIAQAGIPVGVFPNPIMPLITDQQDRLDRLAKVARDCGATLLRRRCTLPDAVLADSLLSVRRKALSASAAALSGEVRTRSLPERPLQGNDQRKNRRDPRQVWTELQPAPSRNRGVV